MAIHFNEDNVEVIWFNLPKLNNESREMLRIYVNNEIIVFRVAELDNIVFVLSLRRFSGNSEAMNNSERKP
ncbi:hypothetical protein T10_5647 [Trichinella papuae]|uniref:Uncharacterized protein n=1 Tax=Trichinella papuae TaxID=268474 RepID=A0A0V1MXM8_9BILA|nr:hypothetical protein T10_5647 [Trichinella papuae]